MTRLAAVLQPLLAMALCLGADAAFANDSRAPAPLAPPPSYADLVDLTDGAALVVRVQPRKIVAVEAARARGVRPGWGRYYVEARTEALVFGSAALGPAQRYLVDLPLDAKGKAPAIKKKSVLVFARAVAGRPGELQLVAPDAQLAWTPELDARVRAVLAELNAAGAPRRVTGVREAIHVAGALAGQGESQFFLATPDGEPAAIVVSSQPGQPPRWSVTFSELVGEAGDAPPRDSLAWYRLACFLAPTLPVGTNVSGSQADRAAAGRDYRFVIAQLGPCLRTRGG